MNGVHELVNRLDELTAHLMQRLPQAGYEELAEFTEQRAQLVAQIELNKHDLNHEHKEIIRELAAHDQAILAKMNIFKNEAGQWLQRQEAIKEQKSAYNSSYTTDGMFFDRRN
ncbi:hypothetical protein [Paenibacillus medicaginis]|uniref:Flagellar protein FliT n=1 Tax=Paenibacillus medicaginis TaxID=1470560 RepID=A0ABV5BX52_9BACL